MQDLNLALVQFDIIWENPSANISKLDTLFHSLEKADIILLPEMFTTGFTMNPEVHAETFHSEMTTLNWMKDKAAQKNAVVMGSVAIKENDLFYNSMFIVFPNRTFVRYEKNKLFSMGEENKHYTSGTKAITFEWLGWKIKPLICYELRFPDLACNSKENPFDLLLYVANWPEVRKTPWRTLLQARAIENQCYLAGVNRVGTDPNKLTHSGDSLVVDAKGELLADGKGGEEKNLYATLNWNELQDFRSKFPVLNDR
ncbi:MAG: amidohydrolase [Flavobacteriales bacterium]